MLRCSASEDFKLKVTLPNRQRINPRLQDPSQVRDVNWRHGMPEFFRAKNETFSVHDRPNMESQATFMTRSQCMRCTCHHGAPKRRKPIHISSSARRIDREPLRYAGSEKLSSVRGI
ncbi:uncharacterized protein ARMOST_19101 [Armillaria ostoyae]|uniref:Uncharacterized protein n=1 Tax=Armillaria ostoyae TaxID=47428 RepID=A0A284S3M8_ARMOS|nr:uncharacterized protein ARMOST_19101 [Armillaria ostoyae]